MNSFTKSSSLVAALLLSPSGVLGSEGDMCMVEVATPAPRGGSGAWCGGAHNKDMYSSISDRATLASLGLTGSGLNFHSVHGWYVCGIAPHVSKTNGVRLKADAEKCMAACVGLGDCAEFSVSRGGCCFFNKSPCEGSMRKYDYKYKVEPCAAGGELELSYDSYDPEESVVLASLEATEKRCKPAGRHIWYPPHAPAQGPGDCISMIISNKKCDQGFFNYNPNRRTKCGCIQPSKSNWIGCEPENLVRNRKTSVYALCRTCSAGSPARQLLFASLPPEGEFATARSAGSSGAYSIPVPPDSTAMEGVPCCK